MAVAAQDLTPLGSAIRDMRRRLGEAEGKRTWSHDKLARELGTTRQSVIAWELHDRFPRDFIEELAALGVPRELLDESTSREHLVGRVAELEGEVGELRRRLDEFVEAATERLAALEATPVRATRRSTRRSSEGTG